METKTGWEDGLRELLLNVAKNGTVHLSDVHSDLIQINLLLLEAIGKLGDNIVAIGQAVNKQQELVSTLFEKEGSADRKGASTDRMESISELGDSMEEHVSTLITAMQFQDMTSQLLEKVLVRVTALQEMGSEVQKLAEEIVGAKSEEAVVSQLHETGRVITTLRQKLEDLDTGRVSQKHLDSGTIELF